MTWNRPEHVSRPLAIADTLSHLQSPQGASATGCRGTTWRMAFGVPRSGPWRTGLGAASRRRARQSSPVRRWRAPSMIVWLFPVRWLALGLVDLSARYSRPLLTRVECRQDTASETSP